MNPNLNSIGSLSYTVHILSSVWTPPPMLPGCHRAEMDAIQKGAERQRRKLLLTVPVVGATCCSLLQSSWEGNRFTLVVLDGGWKQSGMWMDTIS